VVLFTDMVGGLEQCRQKHLTDHDARRYNGDTPDRVVAELGCIVGFGS
jgi:hypothetical protein